MVVLHAAVQKYVRADVVGILALDTARSARSQLS
jgi:hypothetical protein